METTTLTKFKAGKRKIDGLFELPKITLKDIEDLSTIEREYLGELSTQKLAQLKGAERNKFLEKIELITHASTKNSIWENNHAVISCAIANLMRQHGCMPSMSLVAEDTGLSRQTVAKHIKEYKAHPEHETETEAFKFMSTRILASVFKNAVNGDMKAARLYFKMAGATDKQPANTVVNEQNNYIQINNTILSQAHLSQLSAGQLNQIESIITNYLDR